MKINPWILIFFLISGCQSGSDQEKTWSDPIQSFENNLLPAIIFRGEPIEPKSIFERMEFYKVPGVSVAVFKNGNIEWTNGYGFLSYEGSGRIEPHTLFHTPMIENFFITGAFMTLVEQNQISLNQKLSAYIKTSNNLLVKDLLGNPNEISTLITLIEKISNQPYPKFIKEKFIDFYGLKNTTFNFYPSSASGHTWEGKKLKEFKEVGLWTIPSDLGQFSADINSIYLSKTVKVITKRTLDILVELFSQEINGEKALVLEGLSNGYYVKWISFLNEEGLGYAIFTNSENGKSLSNELEKSLAKTYDWTFNQPDTLARMPIPEEQFKIFQGRYFNEEEQNQLEIIAFSDHIKIHPVGEETRKLEFFAIGDLMLVEKNTGEKINFEVDESGIIQNLILGNKVRYEKIKAL
ncbi:MAG: hypothetical protein RJA52_516 [Bacteroidota bacterium]|jgi:CubicO group peptidase (beta-lactamase class C family)